MMELIDKYFKTVTVNMLIYLEVIWYNEERNRSYKIETMSRFEKIQFWKWKKKSLDKLDNTLDTEKVKEFQDATVKTT